MRIHNLYVDADGETHFRDIEIEWKNEGRGGKTSATLPATGIIFRETPGTYDYEWHPSPRRQYIINLDAGVSIQASDGETRIIGAGAVVAAPTKEAWWDHAKAAFLAGTFRDEHMLLDMSVRKLAEPQDFVQLLRLRRDF